ncbi:unnamed protein product [Brassica napus]|uniref:(rape) hypothetical protein n=1 Tax=Brassica napus TaxID=3708 RepID=A0A816P2E5_BRANA|nr:unnamed protein product [Brassica napus]
MAARRLVTKAFGVETEKKSSEKVVEEEKKEEEAVKVVEEQTGEVEEKQRWIMVVYKEAPSLWIMHRCKDKTLMYGKPRGRPRKNVNVAAPKSGRPKRKCEPSQWVQIPFTEGKKHKTKP